MSIMLASAATDGAPSLGTVVAILVLARVGWYAVQCWWFPLKACGRCEGSGRLKADDGRHGRKCPRCRGKDSWRPRWGRRLFDAVSSRGI